MLIEIPDTVPFIDIARFAESQNCRLQCDKKGSFTFVPTKDSFNLNAALKIKVSPEMSHVNDASVYVHGPHASERA